MVDCLSSRSSPDRGFTLAAQPYEVALITGASSGLGAVFARHLAAEHYNLILVARRRERLHSLAQELMQRHPIQAIPLVADLATTAGIERVEHYIRACRQFTVLVNNAGFATTGSFDTVALQRHLDMVMVHVTASVRLCHAALPTMLMRQRGAIINVSSVAGAVPVAGNVSYSASKAYLTTFTRSLHSEVHDRGIVVQALCPGYTSSEILNSPDFAAFDRYAALPRLLWMTAEAVVACSLRELILGRTLVIPGLHNRLLIAAQTYPLAGLLWRLLVRSARLADRFCGTGAAH